MSKGFTLIELACALAVLSIIFVPFMSLITYFNGINNNSRIIYRSGLSGQNILESLKGKSFLELYELIDNPPIPDDEFRYKLKATAYPSDKDGNSCCDIIIKKDQGILSYIRYPVMEPLVFEANPDSTALSLTISSGGDTLGFCYEDNTGKCIEYTLVDTDGARCFHLYINQKPNDYPVSFIFEGFKEADPDIYLYDDLFSTREVTLTTSDKQYFPHNGYMNNDERDLPFRCIYTPDDLFLYVATEVLVYDYQNDDLPVNRRTGILKVRQ